eukprot:TRINITY_DN49108_c0_g1_i1.p2 TRINITY_DN49108_c0_g1~~TRINITY_DN49108_c0_g1_i1.p2  ORF type:complete len:113 (+),score=7.86 TRINITY_DN49108_c0_g1_i1:456-794(+)
MKGLLEHIGTTKTMNPPLSNKLPSNNKRQAQFDGWSTSLALFHQASSNHRGHVSMFTNRSVTTIGWCPPSNYASWCANPPLFPLSHSGPGKCRHAYSGVNKYQTMCLYTFGL